MRIIEIITILVFFIAFYGLITSTKMIKSIVMTILMEASVIMFFLSIGFHSEILPPIGAYFEDFRNFADPLPQALMITAIIIGVAVTTIKITMIMAVFRQYKTTDWDEAKFINRDLIVDRSSEE
jgi:multicomponent Na+:H+ antiporter subunit C